MQPIIVGICKKGRLNVLLIKQKKLTRKNFNLRYRDHTNKYFIEASILKLPELIEHTTVCYMQSGIMESPSHIKNLRKIRKQARDDLRDQQIQLAY